MKNKRTKKELLKITLATLFEQYREGKRDFDSIAQEIINLFEAWKKEEQTALKWRYENEMRKVAEDTRQEEREAIIAKLEKMCNYSEMREMDGVRYVQGFQKALSDIISALKNTI